MSQDTSAAERSARSARLARCLERAAAGETRALDDVVRELNPLLWHVARSQGLDAHEVADVVQTTWLELVRHLDEIRTPGALTAWLVMVTKREAWHANRRRRRLTPSDQLVDQESLDPEPVQGVLASERARALWLNFQKLTEQCQRLLRIVAMVDRPDYAAVSDALGMPHGSIGPTRGRCLEKLRKLLPQDPLWSSP